jgi:hypothetical protein
LRNAESTCRSAARRSGLRSSSAEGTAAPPASFAVRLARLLDFAARCLELCPDIGHIEVGILAGGSPQLDENEKIAVDLDRLFAQHQKLACLDGEIPELRRRRGERLARVGVVERGRFRIRLGCGALRPQPAPQIDFPRRTDESGVAGKRGVIQVVGGVGAELHADRRQESRPDDDHRLPGDDDIGRRHPQVRVVADGFGNERFECCVVERLQPGVRQFTAARIGTPRRRNVRGCRQRLVDDVLVRGRRLQGAASEHCDCNEYGGTHQPENGYNQLYQE